MKARARIIDLKKGTTLDKIRCCLLLRENLDRIRRLTSSTTESPRKKGDHYYSVHTPYPAWFSTDEPLAQSHGSLQHSTKYLGTGAFHSAFGLPTNRVHVECMYGTFGATMITRHLLESRRWQRSLFTDMLGAGASMDSSNLHDFPGRDPNTWRILDLPWRANLF